MSRPLKIGIVGSGKIAASHASQISSLPDCEVVGVCSRTAESARAFSERFGVKHHFTDIQRFIDEARPDVVHITTPPETHFDLATFCVERSCHVYVEKPFTLNAEQARELLRSASQKGIKVTVGHNNQFSPVANRMRALIRTGYLGGPPVHVESCYTYDLADERYARVFLSNKTHWVRQLPGRLLQNVISHGIARIAQFLTSDDLRVIAHGYASSYVKREGAPDILDELRVIISEPERMTAYFTFSSQMRPFLHELRVFGPKNGLVLDESRATLIKLRGQRFRSFAEIFVPPLLFAGQQVANLAVNTGLLLGGRLHPNAGMRNLIEAFYRSVRENLPVPIAYEEIVRTAGIMDAIFAQLGRNEPASGALMTQAGGGISQ